MRGLVGLVLFSVACSAGPQDFFQEPLIDGASGAAEVAAGGRRLAAGSHQAGATVAAGGSPESGAGSEGQAGSKASAGAPAGGAGGSGGQAGHLEAAAGRSGATEGGSSSAGAAQGGSSGAPGGAGGAAANQCAGFTPYTVEVNTCLAVTGDFQQQTDPACSAAGIVSRDHCTTCAAWNAVEKSTVVLLAVADGATMKRYDAPGGACPSNCKYICN